MQKTAVIILNYKTWKNTLEEIENVHEACNISYTDIIIVDNFSNNGSVENLKKYNNGFIIITASKNKGYAYGNNIGLRYAEQMGYSYALIINNDIIINDNILNEMIKVIHSDINIAAVNPDVYSKNGHLYNRDSKRPNVWDFTFGMYAYKFIGRRINKKNEYAIVYRPQGCCMLLDLGKVKKINYLDEHTFLYSEEIILAERLSRMNYKCACAFNVSVIHDHSSTVRKNIDLRKINKIKVDSFKYYLAQYRNYSKPIVDLCCFFYMIKLHLLK